METLTGGCRDFAPMALLSLPCCVRSCFVILCLRHMWLAILPLHPRYPRYSLYSLFSIDFLDRLSLFRSLHPTARTVCWQLQATVSLFVGVGKWVQCLCVYKWLVYVWIYDIWFVSVYIWFVYVSVYDLFMYTHTYVCVWIYVMSVSVSLSVSVYVCIHIGALDEELAVRYTQQILSGLSYLHRHCMMHRHVSCCTCLVTSTGLVKLADFGELCVTHTHTHTHNTHTHTTHTTHTHEAWYLRCYAGELCIHIRGRTSSWHMLNTHTRRDICDAMRGGFVSGAHCAPPQIPAARASPVLEALFFLYTHTHTHPHTHTPTHIMCVDLFMYKFKDRIHWLLRICGRLVRQSHIWSVGCCVCVCV